MLRRYIKKNKWNKKRHLNADETVQDLLGRSAVSLICFGLLKNRISAKQKYVSLLWYSFAFDYDCIAIASYTEFFR